MKKLYSIIFILLFTITLSGCETPPTDEPVDCDKYPSHEECTTDEPDPITCETDQTLVDGECVDNEPEPEPDTDFLEIYYLNDFHGALTQESDQLGISYIANLVNSRKEAYPDNVLFITGGDILQGSALSNYYSGLSTINLFNLANLDVFTIGNHEFDWGLDVIEDYKDGNLENGEADFPFLGANIYYEGTTTSPEWLEPYVVIEKGDYKVGIIGTIGYGLEYAIAEAKVAPYDFGNPLDIIDDYAEHLRTVEGCDIVIVSAHDTGRSLNDELVALSGSQNIDVVFNGHSHSEYAYIDDNTVLMQSGDNGEYVGYVRIDFDEQGNPSFDAENLNKFDSDYFDEVDTDVDALLQTYISEISDLIGAEIIVSGEYYSSGELSVWLADLMRQASNSDVAFHNYGGTRNSIDNGESISMETLYQIWPFDNVIKTVYLPGNIVQSLVANGGYATSTDITSFDDYTMYKVATNDYVFDKTTNPFLDGTDIRYTGIIIRDLVEDELLLQGDEYSFFYTSNPLLSEPY